jgi:hypothetical protein
MSYTKCFGIFSWPIIKSRIYGFVQYVTDLLSWHFYSLNFLKLMFPEFHPFLKFFSHFEREREKWVF